MRTIQRSGAKPKIGWVVDLVPPSVGCAANEHTPATLTPSVWPVRPRETKESAQRNENDVVRRLRAPWGHVVRIARRKAPCTLPGAWRGSGPAAKMRD